MRFLHTSDWHLGRSLHRADLREAQAAFLDHLVETARSERVDAVLVAGDVYDRAIPPVDAVALYEDALARLRAAGARVILISGNHDSARRLGVNSALVDAAGVHLRTRPGRSPTRCCLTTSTARSPSTASPTWSRRSALPSGRVPSVGCRGRDASHANVLGAAVGLIRADAAARGAARTVVLAHAWVAGGPRRRRARGRRPAAVERVRAGHLGRRHRLRARAACSTGSATSPSATCTAGRPWPGTCATAGSPLPYSFSEKDHQKGSWLVEVDADGTASAEWVPAPVYRRLADDVRAASTTCSPRASMTGTRATSSR